MDVIFGKTDQAEGFTVDREASHKPSVVADWEHLPFKDGAFRFGYWDPPYDHRYDRCLLEILRATRERVAILHTLVYPVPDGWRREAVIAVTMGPNKAMRALQVFRREGVPAAVRRAGPQRTITGRSW